MTVALEHAGAEYGLLVLLRGDRLQIEAEARTDRKTVTVRLREDTVTSAELPESLLHTVIRTKESVILDDASAQNAFSADAYIRRLHPRSVLCLPLVKQAELVGLLYLENNLAPGVFTPVRTSVLKLLSSQMAISLENARLYADLSNENRDRQKAEDALRESERLWRSLFENTLVGIVLTNPQGRFVAVNAAYCKMFGYSEAELIRLSPLEITHEDDREASRQIVAAHAAGRLQTLRFEKRYRTKSGDVVWTEVSASTVSVAGSTPLIAGFVLDITDRKRAEENLRRSEAFLAQAQEITQTGSWRWNVATGEVGWSTEHFRIFGFDPAATQPSYATFMERIEPDDRVAFARTLEIAVRDKSPFQMEYRITLPDGTAKRLQSVGRPDITSYGELEFVGTVMDITERRRAEEALRDAQADLAHVARLTTMGQLVASIAHEINQPLTAIVSNGDTALLWLNRDKPDIGEARNALSRIVRDAMRAGGVIRGLRALAMKSGPELATFDINDAVREVLTLTGSELKRHGIVLRTDLLTAGPPGRRRPGSVAAGRTEPGLERDRSHEADPGAPPRAHWSPRPSPSRAQSWSRSRTPAPGWRRRSRSVSSNPSSPRSPTAWAWGFRSADRSSKPMGDGCGRRPANRRAPRSASPSASERRARYSCCSARPLRATHRRIASSPLRHPGQPRHPGGEGSR